MQPEIMYIEAKESTASLNAIIGLVQKSKTGKTLRYKRQAFQSLGGTGFKANYFDVSTGQHYWISGCRKDGNDGLYKTNVYIDEDVRHAYWTKIRAMPERREQASFISAGKHRAGGKEPKRKSANL